MPRKVVVGLYLSVAAVLEAAGFAAARAASDTDANSEHPEIIVTARRHEESAQDVPLAISVLSAASLDSTGTLNIGDLTHLQPTVQFYSSNPRNSAITIRGLGSPFGLTNDGIEPGVGVYVDQVYYARPAASTFDFIDIDQLEILRGPQGTLYGKNTTAGAVSVTSRKPTFSPEIDGRSDRRKFRSVQGKASVSGPLIADTLAGRVGFSYTHRDGTIYDVTTGRNINEEYNAGLRGQAVVECEQDAHCPVVCRLQLSEPVGVRPVVRGHGRHAASGSAPVCRTRRRFQLCAAEPQSF